MSGGHTLRIERTFQAPADRVFDAWTSEEVMRRWWHAEKGWETPEAEVDLQLGGAVRVVMRDPESGDEFGGGGEYVEIDPPRRLAFTWVWDDESRRTLIEIDFHDRGDSTHVVFTHSNLIDIPTLQGHEGGWTRAMDNLDAELASNAR